MINKKLLRREKVKTTHIVFMCLFVMFCLTGCGGGNDLSSESAISDQIEVSDNSSGVSVPDDNSAGEPGAVGNVIDVDASDDKMVSLSLENVGRANPFVPASEAPPPLEQVIVKKDPGVTLPKLDIVDPPSGSDKDSDATKVVTTKISGIMFDKYNPSAIINIENSDYLVRSGDVINGYKILAISPQTVTVQRGSNVYKAGVGELVTGDKLNFNKVPNLTNKFGGQQIQSN